MKRQRNDWRMLLITSATCAACIALHPTNALAIGPQEPPSSGRSFGLGMVLGDPTGLTGEKWLGNDTALDFSAAWSLEDNESMELAVDHVWYNFSALEWDNDEGRGTDNRRIALHYGLGGRLLFMDHGDDRAGLRVPVGLTYFTDRGRIGIFAQVAPTLDVVPSTEGDLQGGLGVRYFMN